ncbi:helix-turn-helix domain-containing protein [Pseudomonas fragariae (ex Marin et al. 2024)]|uniref:helix-turn-helix domain-containing protein n=1 Tax=Pseudomonas fragariae (ex Marin et al. 2024) TaxID=3080056 RepID=UPI003F78F985
MDNVRDLLASRLKQLRTSKGLKQAQVAEAAGLEVNTVSRYERATITPSIEHLLKLATALGVHPIEILPQTDDTSRRMLLLLTLKQDLADRASRIRSPSGLQELIKAADAILHKESL